MTNPSTKKPIPPKEELEEYYKSHTREDCKKHYNVGGTTLNKWLVTYDIKKERESLISDEMFNEMYRLYTEEHYSLAKLTKKYNISGPTIKKEFLSRGVDIRDHLSAARLHNRLFQTNYNLPSKEVLEKEYAEDSLNTIYSRYHISQNRLYDLLKEYGIPLKTLSEATAIAKKKQHASKNAFTKEDIEEAMERNSNNIRITSEEFKVSYGHMRSLIKRHGLSFPVPWRSKGEDKLYQFLLSLEPSFVPNDKSIINPFELDAVSHEKRIAVEYCGLYWHSEHNGKKDKNYHQNKYLKCKEKGYRLYTIFESDDERKVQSFFRSVLGKNEKIHARKCTIQEINGTAAYNFHVLHHLNDAVRGSVNVGLFHEGLLVMVASFGKSRFNKHYEWECTRMTSHSDFSVVGGASRLFSFFIKTHSPRSIITYADLRYGEGSVYLNHCGFEYKGLTSPNYWYFDKEMLTNYEIAILESRVKYQKHKLSEKLLHFSDSMTEFQNMVENGYDRIWDCGNASYTCVDTSI